MLGVILTPAERLRMESTHVLHGHVTLRAGDDPVPICAGCGMAWPCPGKRLLDLPTRSRWQRLVRLLRR